MTRCEIRTPPSSSAGGGCLRWPVKRSVLGLCPIAMKTPCSALSVVASVFTFFTRMPVTGALAQEHAFAVALGRATPHAMVDAVAQGVLEARLLDRAGRADAPGNLDAHAIAGKEQRRRLLSAVALSHPLVVHLALLVGLPL